MSMAKMGARTRCGHAPCGDVSIPDAPVLVSSGQEAGPLPPPHPLTFQEDSWGRSGQGPISSKTPSLSSPLLYLNLSRTPCCPCMCVCCGEMNRCRILSPGQNS